MYEVMEGSNLNLLLERTFQNRGYENGFWEEMNRLPHSYPKDTDRLCQRLKHYHDTQELVVLLTDIDTDGVCSGIEGYAGLAELGFNVALYLPPTDSYGFTSKTIADLVSQYPTVKAIVTADVGITCYDGVSYAQTLGIEMLVTDHHKPKGVIGASVWVDPSRPDETTGYSGSCGAAVLYQILLYYVTHFVNDGFLYNQIRRLVVFAGCGTISDSMPLLYENRVLVRDALEVFKLLYGDGTRYMVDSIPGCPVYRRAFQGLYLMMEVFRDCGKNAMFSTTPLRIHEDFIGFYFAPVVNCVKRMRRNMREIYDVFFGPEPLKYMEQLYNLNKLRKVMVEEKFGELLDGSRPQPWAPYIYISDGHPGIFGLMAQKLLNMTGEPVFVLTPHEDGSYSGSGRCPEWFPFLKLGVYSRWSGAGHNTAFGITVNDDVAMDELVRFVKAKVPELKPADWSNEPTPDFVLSMFGDGDAGLDVDLMTDYMKALDEYRPFGTGFPEPECLLRLDRDQITFKLFGGGEHVRILLPQGLYATVWHAGDLIRETCHTERERLDDGRQGNQFIWLPDSLPKKLELYGRWEYDSFSAMVDAQRRNQGFAVAERNYIQFTGEFLNVGGDC